MKCFLVDRNDDGTIQQSLDDRSLPPVSQEQVEVDVAYSSLNYKDALAASGHAGVVRSFPHVPGIDAAGTICQSANPSLPPGMPVVVTGYGMGSSHWGGWAEKLQVPARWVIPLPDSLSMLEAMALGTAGLTAALSLQALENHGVTPDSGPLAVSGSSGGVGSLAVRILAKLGFQVIAVTNKTDFHKQLLQWGARECWSPHELAGDTAKPMLRGDLAAGIDTNGGTVLTSMLRRLQPRGCVAACGMASSPQLDMTVYPFILRGISLVGIDSAEEPLDSRAAAWNRLAGSLLPDHLEQELHLITLANVASAVEDMLAGRITGRTVIEIAG